MEAECHVCGGSYPSRFYFAAPGICRTCYGGDADAAAPHVGSVGRAPILERRMWLGVGGWVFLLGTFLIAIVQFAMAIGGGLLFGQGLGPREGAGVFLVGLFNVVLILAVGLPVSAIFFTLRAWDERFRRQDAAAKADLST